MREVYQAEVRADSQEHVLRVGQIVHVGLRRINTVEVWYEGGPAGVECDPLPERTFQVFRTGQPIPDGWAHRGTVLAGAELVWHLYEKTS